MTPNMVRHPEELAALFELHRDAHLYGLADLAEPFWSLSTWWRRGDAVVGLVGLPGVSESIVYAISPIDPDGSRDLLAELAAVGALADRFVVTGPVGLVNAVAASHDPVWDASYQKMAWQDRSVPPTTIGAAVRLLDQTHTDAIQQLRAADGTVGGFFHTGLLAIGPYVGWFEGDRLVAMAGVHVADRDRGVVAIGNVATHPDHRRRGLARSVVSALLRELTGFASVGLNVAKDNVAATRLYESLGFGWVLDYDEAELRARDL